MLTLIEMSATGGVLIAAIVVIRALSIHRLPKKVFLALWAVALCRLLLPFSIPSPASVYTAAERIGVTVRRPGVLTGAVAQGAPAAGVPTALLIWAGGCVLLAAVFLLLHLRGRRSYAASLPAEHPFVLAWLEEHRLRRPVRARTSDQVDAPFTYGVLWPVIVLPTALDWADETRLAFVLAHEMAHIRRCDALIKWVLAATLCLHWCNPLVWVMYVLSNRDLELSCDETVVHMYGAAARASYALTLVGLEEKRARFAPLTSSFGKNAMEERIAAIMKSKKTTVAGIAVALLLVAVVTTVFATSSQGGSPTPSPTQAPASSAVSRNSGTPIPGAPSAVSGGSTQIKGIVDASLEAAEKITQAVIADNENWYYREEKVDPVTGHYYTKDQYDLVAALKTDRYETQPIAAFNRTLNATLNGDNEKLYEAYERLLSDLPADDALAPFVYNTMQASLDEYSARVQEVYSGKQYDPSFRGSARHTVHADVFGDSVEVAYAQADYRFTYRILDQEKLTVAARDKFLQDILTGVQAWVETLDLRKEADEAALKAEIDRLGKAASNATIAYSDVEIDYFDAYAQG